MELFHKIYSCYYNVVRHILDEAGHSPITRQDMEDICRAYGFQESALSIIPKLTDGTWALLEEQDRFLCHMKSDEDFVDQAISGKEGQENIRRDNPGNKVGQVRCGLHELFRLCAPYLI